MKKVLIYFGYLLSFLYTFEISNVIHKIRNYVYTGWMKRIFKNFEGIIKGKIGLLGSQYISVGVNSVICNNVKLWAYEKYNDQQFTPEIVIGNNTVIQDNCFISAVNKIEIGDNVAIANNSVVIDNVHGDFRAGHMHFTQNEEIPDVFLNNVQTRDLASKGPVIIEDNVHIGMYCMIMPGVTIGHNSVVNAHSVVTRNVPPYSIVSGNPAKIVLSFKEEK